MKEALVIIHSLAQQLLSIYLAPDTMLSGRGTVENKIYMFSSSEEFIISKRDN